MMLCIWCSVPSDCLLGLDWPARDSVALGYRSTVPPRDTIQITHTPPTLSTLTNSFRGLKTKKAKSVSLLAHQRAEAPTHVTPSFFATPPHERGSSALRMEDWVRKRNESQTIEKEKQRKRKQRRALPLLFPLFLSSLLHFPSFK